MTVRKQDDRDRRGSGGRENEQPWKLYVPAAKMNVRRAAAALGQPLPTLARRAVHAATLQISLRRLEAADLRVVAEHLAQPSFGRSALRDLAAAFVA